MIVLLLLRGASPLPLALSHLLLCLLRTENFERWTGWTLRLTVRFWTLRRFCEVLLQGVKRRRHLGHVFGRVNLDSLGGHQHNVFVGSRPEGIRLPPRGIRRRRGGEPIAGASEDLIHFGSSARCYFSPRRCYFCTKPVLQPLVQGGCTGVVRQEGVGVTRV